MALINCAECKKEISDKAKTCPNCGMPLININQPMIVHNQNQDRFLTRNRGCLEIFFWFVFALFIIGMLKAALTN